MAFTKSTADLANISKLDDEPNDVGGLSAAELKAEFDAAAETLQSFVNSHITELESSTAAGNVGALGLDGTTASNVQAVIVAIKALIDACETQAAATSALSLKEDKTVTAQHYKSVTFNANTGIFTFTRENGSTTSIDTALEKVATNWTYDAATQSLVLTLADGSTQSVSLSAFITENEYLDSDTLDFSVSDHKITATIKSGSITDTMLASALKTTLQNYVTQAGTSATNAAASESNSLAYKNDALAAQIAAVNAKTAAETAAEDAEVSAANAATSETNAKTSETNAKTSETNAKTSETNAANSASTASSCASQVADAMPIIAAKSASGVYVGTGEMPEGYNFQIDPTGDALTVVNDLTTGGTTNALSAEQGKALDASISELSTKVLEKTSYGIYAGLAVSAQSTPNMTVSVATGTIYMANGDRFTPTANTALAITAADTTNPRIDIVYVNSSGVISYLAGTAAASPTAPSVPTGGQLLAQITVAAGATSITSAAIADRRKNLWTEAWITPTLLNGWTENVSYPVRYFKDTVGNIHIAGLLQTGTSLATAFLLPTGYRPNRRRVFAVDNGGSHARLYILPTGEVQPQSTLIDFGEIIFSTN